MIGVTVRMNEFFLLVSVFVVGTCCLQMHKFMESQVFVEHYAEPSLIPPQTRAYSCANVSLDNVTIQEHFKSQSGEDKVLLKFFNGLCGGTYLEMGALDGIWLSNSFFFNKELTWKGVLVEPSPRSYAKLRVNRPHELATIHAVVCADQQLTMHYYDAAKAGHAVSGLWEFAGASFRDQWWPGASLNDTTPVECRTLANIIASETENVEYFDFMTLDCEGCELTALQSIDWSATAFGIILIEADRHSPSKNQQAMELLTNQNYKYFGNISRSNWFLRPQFDEIYRRT